jgi:hypothetical protein
VAVEGIWLLVALRARWRPVLFAVGAVVAVGLALLPLISAQIDPTHIGWIDHSLLSTRLFETGGSFLMGETGHVIAQPSRERYALIPALLIGLALLLVVFRGSIREKRAAALGLTLGLGVVIVAAGIALAGRDYIVERNLLPALIPLFLAAAAGFAASGARRVGIVLAIALCAYWLAFDIHVTRTLNLQRPDFRDVVERLGPPVRPRAIVTWTLAADGVQFYLGQGSRRKYRGKVPIREIDLISKAVVVGRPADLPPAFHPVERLRLERLTLTRYIARGIHRVPVLALRDARTGFGRNAVITDGMPALEGVNR